MLYFYIALKFQTKMKDKIEKAVQNFANGFNCAQSVLSAYNQEFNINDDDAFQLTSAYFGGLSFQDQTCGAILGAYLVIGLKYGSAKPNDAEAKARILNASKIFAEKFKEKHGEIDCSSLVGLDLSKPEDRKRNQEEGTAKKVCPKYIEEAVRIIESIE